MPLGAAFVVLEPLSLPEEFDLPGLAAEHPWAPIVVQETGAPADTTIVRVLKGHASLKQLIVLSVSRGDVADPLRRTLAQEGAPTRKEVADYIVDRCGLGVKFADAIGTALATRRSAPASTTHGRLSKHGKLTGKHWEMLYQLVRSLSVPAGFKRSDAAEVLEIDLRTLNGYCQRFLLGMDWDDARRQFGWKWLVEVVLRREGYVGKGASGQVGKWARRKVVRLWEPDPLPGSA